ncbi:pyridoxal-phosphate dependent enzyme [Ectopseudomonas mendocina]|uniref:Pyridoxal-phosphate dependent enzyme n=1 Tax=Ectopseudomonas mendocina TaxID=300 RepID=A0ABZ2RBU6_ECTME
MPVILPAWAPQAPLQSLSFDWAAAAGVQLAVLRLDLLDPLISGNKWFKLRHHLQAAAECKAAGVISLGGVHSNHLHALAAAGKRFGFKTVGLLRGDEQDTPTVRDLRELGMQVHWLGYGGYRQRHAPGFWAPWLKRYPQFYPVPEGGAGEQGMEGCAQIVTMIRQQLPLLGWDDYDACWLAAGTGTTAAGMLLAEELGRTVHVAAAVPPGHGVEACLKAVADQARAGYVLHDASCGGFAKTSQALLDFMLAAEVESGVPLESVYTAKALMALRHCVLGDYLAAGSRLVFVHTGGLQGRAAALSAVAKIAK